MAIGHETGSAPLSDLVDRQTVIGLGWTGDTLSDAVALCTFTNHFLIVAIKTRIE